MGAALVFIAWGSPLTHFKSFIHSCISAWKTVNVQEMLIELKYLYFIPVALVETSLLPLCSVWFNTKISALLNPD